MALGTKKTLEECKKKKNLIIKEIIGLYYNKITFTYQRTWLKG